MMSRHRVTIFEAFERRRLLTATPQANIDSIFVSEFSWSEAGEPPRNEEVAAGQESFGHGFGCCCPDCGRVQEFAFENDDTAAGWDTGTAASITHVVTVQPIILSNDDGSNTAEFFGSASQQLIIEDLIDSVWAQAGIDIDWLAPNSWNNTRENFGDRLPRPSSDLSRIVSQGDAAGVGNENSLILDMYFVEIAAGFDQLGNNYANGLAFVGGNGSTMHVGDNLPTFAAGREVVARVVAHEIGHNLGLRHVSDSSNLMDSGERLTASQISTAINSQFSIPLPDNSAPVVSNPISDVVVEQDSSNTVIDLTPVFSDPDGDSLSFSIANNNNSLVNATLSGNNLTLQYLAGQSGEATITVTAEDPRGASVSDSFTVTVQATSPDAPTDLGTIDYELVDGLSPSSTTWYEMQASQDGFLTMIADYSPQAGNLTFDLFDSSMGLLSSGSGEAGNERIDVDATRDGIYYLRVTGDNSDLSLTLVNLVDTANTSILVSGTTGDESFAFTPGSNQQVQINSVSYFFANSYDEIVFNESEGSDTIVVQGLPTAEAASFRPGQLLVSGSGFTLSAQVDNATVHSGGGSDSALFEDSPGDDVLNAGPANVSFSGAGFSHTATGLWQIEATSQSGLDVAYLFDSSGDDTLTAQPDQAVFENTSGSFRQLVSGFAQVLAHSIAGGNDTGQLIDGPTEDHFATYPDYAFLYALNGDFFNYAYGFSSLIAVSSQGGNDAAIFSDGPTDDTLTMTPSVAEFASGNGQWSYRAEGFPRAYAYASAGGFDQATLQDSPQQEVFYATPVHGFYQGSDFLSYANGFESLTGISSAGGADQSFIYDGPTNDVLFAEPFAVNMTDDTQSYEINANGFVEVYVTSLEGGDDTVSFVDSDGDDQFVALPDRGYLRANDSSFINHAQGFDSYMASASSGQDSAVLYDGPGNDVFDVSPTTASMSGAGFLNRADNFETVFGYSSAGGTDTAIFRDGQTNDEFTGSPEFSSMRDTQGSYTNYATGFAQVEAYSSNGGTDTASLFDSAGDDQLTVTQQHVLLSGPGFSYQVFGFPVVFATSSRGGTDNLDFEAVDYLFQAFGNWI